MCSVTWELSLSHGLRRWDFAVPRTHFAAQVTQQVSCRCNTGRKTLSRLFSCVVGCDPFPKGSFGRQNCSMFLLHGCRIREFVCFNMGESTNSWFKWRDLESRSPCGLRAVTEHPGSTDLIGKRALAGPAAAGAEPLSWGEIFSLSMILWLLQPPEGSFLFGWRIQGPDRMFLC